MLKTADSDHKIAEGGLRLQGKYKAGSAERPLITVVTVVFNGVEYLENTIKSVIEQTYYNLEYIIVDGGSTDGTLDILRKYEGAIDYWVSEPDKGIYDAMNKSIDLGSGQWINFMNAGDYFFDSEVLCKVFKEPAAFDGIDVVYGDHEVRYPNKTKIVKAGRVEDLWKASQFCHQSAIVNLKYHKKNKFNLQRKIAADFEFFYASKRSGILMSYVPYVLSRVSSGGVSDSKRLDSIRERFDCLDNSLLYAPYYIFLMSLEFLKLVVKKYVKA
nr:glycosyltransferase family 2 protein [Stutzerimonas stutzeri]